MNVQLLLTSAATIGLLAIASIFVMRRQRSSKTTRADMKLNGSALANKIPESTVKLTQNLQAALPESVIILPHDVAAFDVSTKSYWAQQESELPPACVVRPHNSQQLSSAVKILKQEYDVWDKERTARGEASEDSLFAVRGGGHSAVPGAAAIKNGVLIDLGRLCEVVPSDDGCSVAVGAGARWMDVSKVLDEKGLAAVGGRNSHVGVGGLTLGGGLSFFSPQFGLVCSNVIEYELVLASGQIIIASASTNPDIWRALKGGANNFGIVARFTLRTFPSPKIWSGFLYLPAYKPNRVLAAFHASVARADPALPSFDKHAAGPIACFTYLQALNLQAISVNLVYTAPPETPGKWPAYWKATPFSRLWRLWNTCKLRTLTSATDEMNALNPPGRRQVLAATTIRNDQPTIEAVHAAYRRGIDAVRRIKGISWTLVLQPFVPEWARKGDPNPLGLDEGTAEPLVIVSFTVNWGDPRDDEAAKSATRHTLEEIEEFAGKNGTGHRYRYVNYCAQWQAPFEGYGEKNWEWLKEVSKEYDPEGMFQRGCRGGFKLWD